MDSLACPHCGADHNSGWREEAGSYDGLDIPDPEFNYDEFVKQEFGPLPKPRGVKTIWWVTAILLSVGLIVFYLVTRWR